MIFDVNLKMLRIARDQGHCLCDLGKPCPCDEFLDKQICKCGAYKILKEL